MLLESQVIVVVLAEGAGFYSISNVELAEYLTEVLFGEDVYDV